MISLKFPSVGYNGGRGSKYNFHLQKYRQDGVKHMMDLKQGITVPHGEEKVMIELTVKEAIALTGIRFNEEPEVLTEARKKVKKTVDAVVLEQ